MDNNLRSLLILVSCISMVTMLSVYGFLQTTCGGGIRSCNMGEACPYTSVCVRYSAINARCSPGYCAAVASFNADAVTFWRLSIEQPVTHWYGAARTWLHKTR